MFLSITTLCFAGCYGVTLALELSRLLFRSGVRGAVMVGFGALGLVTHTWYLGLRAVETSTAPLSSAQDWYLVAAWVLAAMYLALTYYYPKSAVGLFMMPLVLALIGAAELADDLPLSRSGASQFWGTIHGVTLLLGTISVLIGFVAGVMYLLQARRLKLKHPRGMHFQLPPLERLGQVNGSAITLSAVMLGAGFLSGTILNVVSRHLPWSDPVVWSTTLMFAWQSAAALFNVFYRAAREGRKVAYLTTASFVFLVIALGAYIVGHGGTASSPETSVGVSLLEDDRAGGRL